MIYYSILRKEFFTKTFNLLFFTLESSFTNCKLCCHFVWHFISSHRTRIMNKALASYEGLSITAF